MHNGNHCTKIWGLIRCVTGSGYAYRTAHQRPCSDRGLPRDRRIRNGKIYGSAHTDGQSDRYITITAGARYAPRNGGTG